MIKATISSKGQIAIPKAVRERLNLKAGTELSIDVQGQALIMRRTVRSHPDWRTMRGMAQGGESLTKAWKSAPPSQPRSLIPGRWSHWFRTNPPRPPSTFSYRKPTPAESNCA